MATTVQEIEEHERKPDTSEKQSVEMNASCSKIRLEEAEEEQEDVGSWIASCKPIKQQLRVHKPSVCIVVDVCPHQTVSTLRAEFPLIFLDQKRKIEGDSARRVDC